MPRKLRLACDLCHQSKVKCTSAVPDRTRPVPPEGVRFWSVRPCERCSRLGKGCTFSPPDPRPAVKKQKLENGSHATTKTATTTAPAKVEPPTAVEALIGSNLQNENTQPRNRQQEKEFAIWSSALSLDDFLNSIDSPFSGETFPMMNDQLLHHEFGADISRRASEEAVLATDTLDAFNQQLAAQLQSSMAAPVPSVPAAQPLPTVNGLNTAMPPAAPLPADIPPPPAAAAEVQTQARKSSPSDSLLQVVSQALDRAMQAQSEKQDKVEVFSEARGSLLPITVRAIQILAEVVTPHCQRLGIVPGGDAARAAAASNEDALHAIAGGLKQNERSDKEARTTFLQIFSLAMQIVTALHAIACSGRPEEPVGYDKDVLAAVQYQQDSIPPEMSIADAHASGAMTLSLPRKVARLLKIGIVTCQCQALINVLQDVQQVARASHRSSSNGVKSAKVKSEEELNSDVSKVMNALSNGKPSHGENPLEAATTAATAAMSQSIPESAGDDQENSRQHDCVVQLLAVRCQEGALKLKTTLDALLPA